MGIRTTFLVFKGAWRKPCFLILCNSYKNVFMLMAKKIYLIVSACQTRYLIVDGRN